MKSFETVREHAAQLHLELVRKGADPQKPESMIAHAIEHYDLELTFLALGDPALKGAKALFDEQSGTICAAKVSSAAPPRPSVRSATRSPQWAAAPASTALAGSSG